MKTLLHQIKFEGKRPLINLFAEALAGFADAGELPAFDSAVPVPLDEKRLRERGFNQSEVLASLLAAGLELPVRRSLKKIRATPPQSSLNRKKRLENLSGSFSVAEPARVQGKRVLLVDDIYTTGATANECARTLLAAGARSVHCFTLVRAGHPEETAA
ncbi:MAG: ComF family protein [Candidatus Omnitrophica bacterium]|nr:ComF family protein [Candidatus Omnitrophota bacterium]